MNEKTTGFQDKLMKYMMPVANWVEKNNWLQAIKDGMIADIPVIIIGSIFLLPIALEQLNRFRTYPRFYLRPYGCADVCGRFYQ